MSAEKTIYAPINLSDGVIILIAEILRIERAADKRSIPETMKAINDALVSLGAEVVQ